MTEHDRFESRLMVALDRYAERAPIDVDPLAVANHASIADERRGSSRWRGSMSQVQRLAIVLGVVALLLAMLVVVGIGSHDTVPDQLVAVPSDPSTTSSTDGVATSPVAATLRQPWMADQPTTLSFVGESGPRRQTLTVDPTGTSAEVRVTIPRLASTVVAAGPDEIQFTADGTGSPVVDAGVTLPACIDGDTGRYRWSVSSDGLLLRLTSIDDPCASRVAILARSWARALGGDSLGGRGVVDAFDPNFAVTLPAGTYTSTRSSDAIEIWATNESLGLLAFKDPQGFIDPCDEGAGRFDIAPGPDAFVEYFRQNRGFGVVSATDLTVDGAPAVHLLIEARSDLSCPSGWLLEWQPKAQSGELSWHLDPGVRDSLYIVGRPDATVIFQVLEAPRDLEETIVSSVGFVDRVPPEP